MEEKARLARERGSESHRLVALHCLFWLFVLWGRGNWWPSNKKIVPLSYALGADCARSPSLGDYFFVRSHAYSPRHARSQNQQRAASFYGAAVELQVRFRFLALRVYEGGTHPFRFPHVLRSMGGLRYFPRGQNLTPCSVACSGRQMHGYGFSDSEGQSMHCYQRSWFYEALAVFCSDTQPKMSFI